MKKAIFLLSIWLILSSCGVQRVKSGFINLNNDIEFEILDFTNYKTRPGENRPGNKHVTHIAPDGFVYKAVRMRFKNTNSSKIEFDLNKLFLLDQHNRKHKVVYAAKGMKTYAGNRVFKTHQKLNGGKKGLFLVIFDPPFSNEEKISKIAIDTNDDVTLSENARVVNFNSIN
ncbi:hypothetical protein ACFQ3R_12305 [Mesonia ostreae]|uniref:DUF4352 domain-containing protein n=1 Tax=Mesonia ostreae TaxID=861110 RepID=A0ABU2KIP7_9FLAO|nr:hypothetical protein [Mesonia ostreae]MDT0294549.1 hypothetical protein [Mesonia ostreae]